jgi:opacity protein-like surface antigen
MPRYPHKLHSLLVLALMAAASTSAQAAGDWYVGLETGQSRADADKLAGDYKPKLGNSSASADDKVYGLKLGKTLLPWLSVELAYARQGSQTLEHTGTPPPFGPPIFIRTDRFRAERESTAWGADFVATWPAEGDLFVLGSIGVRRVKTTLDTVVLRGSTLGLPAREENVSRTDSATVANYALGAGWRINASSSLTLTYERQGETGAAFGPMFNEEGTGRLAHQAIRLGWTYRF